jgi:hypothetical protein
MKLLIAPGYIPGTNGSPRISYGFIEPDRNLVYDDVWRDQLQLSVGPVPSHQVSLGLILLVLQIPLESDVSVQNQVSR